jgi:hypothetical protein
LINRCQQEIQQAFRSEEYIDERNQLTKFVQEAQEAEFQKMRAAAHQVNFTIVRTPAGFGLIPTIEGKPITPEELGKLSKEHRQKLGELEEKLAT